MTIPTNTIFDATSAGAQQGRIKVYVDFKRKVLWGDVESRITLTGEAQMTNTYVGASGAITTLPVDKELIHTIDDGTNQALPVNSEPYPWLNKHATTSLVKANGRLAPYYDASERSDMQTNVSHGTGGDNNVLVEARFTTTGSGTPGQSTVSFEATHAAANASASDFADGNSFGLTKSKPIVTISIQLIILKDLVIYFLFLELLFHRSHQCADHQRKFEE